MEKGINSYIKSWFGMERVDVATYSPLTLAYIGDEIYDLIIRTVVVGRGNTKPANLHYAASQLVRAHAQSQMMRTIEPMLTQKEADIYRRGRNAKSVTMAKNATMSDYRRATGFEALMGYLYLKDELSRILELVKAGLDRYDEKTGKNREIEAQDEQTDGGEFDGA